MFGRRIAAQGASTKARDMAAPYLRTFAEQMDRFIARAREAQAAGDAAGAQYWVAQAQRVIANTERIQAAC